MIGDLTLALTLQFLKGGLYSGEFDLNILTRQIGVTGKNAVKESKLVTTGDGTFDLGSIGTIGYVLLRNDGAFLIDTPAAPIISNVGTGGAATWTYKIVARKGANTYTVAGSAGSTATGNATLTTGNYNHVKWLPVDDADSYDVYRTVSGGTPATLGKIGNVLAAAYEIDSSGTKYIFLDDKALVGDTTTAPATTPFDFAVTFGSDGSSYPIKLRGQDFAIVRWNAAAVHHKAVNNSAPIFALIIEA